MKLELYDVIINKKADSRTSHRMGILADSLPSKITIRDLLRNVKDAHGQPFINPDGFLSLGNNFYRNVNGSLGNKKWEDLNKEIEKAVDWISSLDFFREVRLGPYPKKNQQPFFSSKVSNEMNFAKLKKKI